MKLKKSLVFDIILTAVILIGTALLFALGTYFMEDRFNVDDAAPLSDPHTTDPGGQSVDVFEVDGSLAISGGKLAVTKQTTAADGDLGMIYETSKGAYIGAATFFKMVPKEFGSTGSAAFGFSDLADNVDNGNAVYQSVLMGATVFEMFNYEQTSAGTPQTLITIPSLNDTFYIAYINGGSDDAAGIAGANPWYRGGGLNLATYAEGSFVFIKKNSGNWILNNVNPVASRANMYPNINAYNASYELYDWVVLSNSDSVYYPYMHPLHYQSCAPTSGQLYDDVPEVGAQYDSVTGDFEFGAGSVLTAPTLSSGQAISTANMGDDDVYMQVTTDVDDASTGRYTYLVMRRNSSTGEHLICGLSTTTNVFEIYSHNGTSYTSRASVAVGIATGTAFKITLNMATLDSSVWAWYNEPGAPEFESLKYTSAANTHYGDGNNNHGIRMSDSTTKLKYIRAYAVGNDGEYANLSNFLSPVGSGGVRRKQVTTQ